MCLVHSFTHDSSESYADYEPTDEEVAERRAKDKKSERPGWYILGLIAFLVVCYTIAHWGETQTDAPLWRAELARTVQGNSPR